MSSQFTVLPFCANPYLPGTEHVPDGEPHIFGNRLYVYGSHDLAGTTDYCTGSYVGWSAPLDNLADWHYEGEIYTKGQDPMDPAGNKKYYAPDAVQGPDGRYYLYYSICDSYVISVAQADSPGGPFHFYGHVRDESGHVLGSSPGDAYQFDPAVLNDHGKIYLYSGQGMPLELIGERKVMGAMVCELREDMLTIRGNQKVLTSRTNNTFTENPFFEASSVRHFGDLYYFVYSPLPNTHFLCYATSMYPDRDFVYRGILVSNADIIPECSKRQIPGNYWGNNHGSLIRLGDAYYVFYHRNTNASPYARQGCAEQIEMLPDGMFRQAEITSTGLSGEPWPAEGTRPAYTACVLHRKDMPPFQPYTFFQYTPEDPFITEKDESQAYVANLRDGAVCGYRYLLAKGGPAELTLRVRCAGEGTIQVFANGELCGDIPLSDTPDWRDFSGGIHLPSGKTELLFSYCGIGYLDLLSFTIREKSLHECTEVLPL